MKKELRSGMYMCQLPAMNHQYVMQIGYHKEMKTENNETIQTKIKMIQMQGE